MQKRIQLVTQVVTNHNGLTTTEPTRKKPTMKHQTRAQRNQAERAERRFMLTLFTILTIGFFIALYIGENGGY